LLRSGSIISVVIFAGILALFPLSTSAADIPLRTLSSTGSDQLNTDLVYVLDREGDLDARTVLERLNGLDWQTSEDEIPNLGLLAEPAWFALRVKAPETMERWGVIDYSALDRIDVYQFHQAELVDRVETGESLAFRKRPFAHRNFVFPLEFEAGQEYLILVRVQTDGSLQLPLELWEPRAFAETEQTTTILQVGFAAMMLALAVYNLLLFFAVRDTAYLWYVLSVVSAALIQVTINGLSYQYLWPGYMALNTFIIPALISVALSASAFFTDRFLNARQISRMASLVCRWIGWIGIAMLLFSLLASY